MITSVGPRAAELGCSPSSLFWVPSCVLGRRRRLAQRESLSRLSLRHEIAGYDATAQRRRPAPPPAPSPFQPWGNSDSGRQGAPQWHINDHALRCELLSARRDRSISRDETRHAVGGGHGDFPPALHRPSPGDGELLLDLASAAVGCVVALHHHYLGAADQGPVDRLVIGQFEADHVADLDRLVRPTATSRTPGPVPAIDWAPTCCKSGISGSSCARKGIHSPNGTRFCLS